MLISAPQSLGKILSNLLQKVQVFFVNSRTFYVHEPEFIAILSNLDE